MIRNEIQEQPEGESMTEVERLRAALVEADIYLAALGWWEIGNIAKAGEVIGNAIGWDKVAVINAQYAPDPGGLKATIYRVLEIDFTGRSDQAGEQTGDP